MISNRYAKCQVHHLFFQEILFRGTPSRAANRSRAKQPAVVSRSARRRRSSSFPFTVPVRRLLAISSSSYRFAPWLQYRSQFPIAAISSSSRQVAKEDARSFSLTRSCGDAKGNRAKGGVLHSRTPLAYMPCFPIQMHSYVKCKVQMHNDWRGFFF